MLTFQVENFSAFRDEAKPLFERHWREIAIDQDRIEFAPDWQQYDSLEKCGILHCLTVRRDGAIVGYFITLLLKHPHYSRSGLFAITDVYYLMPEHRLGGTGAKMLTAWERSLRERNVVKAYLSTKIQDGKDNTRLFERLGWRHTDNSFTKVF